jgi:hypothetical protein
MLLMLIAMGLATGDPQPATQQDPEKPKLICRAGEQQLGTHMRTGRRCKTAEQWQIEDTKLPQVSPSAIITPGEPPPGSAQRPH